MTSGLAAAGRRVWADLTFAVAGDRTTLVRQRVPYPFHITRPFYLNPGRPDLATLYLQSASGGLYRADDLSLAIAAGPGAAAHLVTQAATVVHDTGTAPVRQSVELFAAAGALLAYTPDPLVLFPNAAVVANTKVRLAHGARVVLTDAFASHDPLGRNRPFASLKQKLEIVDEDGRTLVSELGHLPGAATSSAASPLGPFRCCGTLLVLAPADALPPVTALKQIVAGPSRLAGWSLLPAGAGLMLRCLACDGGELRRGLEAASIVALSHLAGRPLEPRRR